MKQNNNETPIQKRKRQLGRKFSYKATYKKGATVDYADKDRLIQAMQQDDVLIRLNSSGTMDDGTAFYGVTIEGINPDLIK